MEMNETKNFGNSIKDSGERRKFETGAVRDIQVGKGRCDLLPLEEISNYFLWKLEYGVVELCDSNKGHRVEDKQQAMMEVFAFLNEWRTTKDNNSINDAIDSMARVSDWGTEYDMILDLSKHYEQGALKYGEFNWQKGIPTHSYLDSGIRHLLKYMNGEKDERHDCAFVWNMFCLKWTMNNKPELDDIK